MSVQIYHNPRCSKSRQTLALIREQGIEPEIIEYLETPLTSDEIEILLIKLGFDHASQLVRKGEALYKELDLKSVENDRAFITAMAAHPKLIERPIVVNGDKAALGRPPKQVLDIL